MEGGVGLHVEEVAARLVEGLLMAQSAVLLNRTLRLLREQLVVQEGGPRLLDLSVFHMGEHV